VRQRKLSLFILVLILGAVLGSVFGELIGAILPQGVAKDFFLRSIEIGFSPHTWDLKFTTLTIGFTLRLNVISILGILAVSYLLRWF